MSLLAETSAPEVVRTTLPATLDVALLTGGFDRPYAFGLAMSLVAQGVRLDVIGSETIDSPEMHTTQNLRFFNLWAARRKQQSRLAKTTRTLRHYLALLRYAAVAHPRVFHILWNSKVQVFDRTLLMLYYKLLGKKVALTAHNVNQDKRDGKDSFLNRLTLRIQYHLTDCIFVHTQKMKDELIADFGVAPSAVAVIRHPLNDAFPDTELTSAEAKRRLGLTHNEKAILCLGKIKPYKGIEHLLTAFRQLVDQDPTYRLIIAGEIQRGNESYWSALEDTARRELDRGQILLKTQFIPDEQMELYLKAADILVLSYNEIFQSGVLFLGYSFGLPVIATDVGSFREEIVEGVTGYLCRPGDPADLASAMYTYFTGPLYSNLARTRLAIREHAALHHSWTAVAEITRNAYVRMLERKI